MLQDLLKKVYEQNDMTDAVNQRAVIDAYNKVVGDLISKLTKKISFAKGVIRVQLSSAALRQELSMRKQSLVEKINESLQNPIVKDISFS